MLKHTRGKIRPHHRRVRGDQTYGAMSSAPHHLRTVNFARSSGSYLSVETSCLSQVIEWGSLCRHLEWGQITTGSFGADVLKCHVLKWRRVLLWLGLVASFRCKPENINNVLSHTHLEVIHTVLLSHNRRTGSTCWDRLYQRRTKRDTPTSMQRAASEAAHLVGRARPSGDPLRIVSFARPPQQKQMLKNTATPTHH